MDKALTLITKHTIVAKLFDFISFILTKYNLIFKARIADNYLIVSYTTKPIESNFVIIHNIIDFRYIIIMQGSYTSFITITNRSNQYQHSNTHCPYFDCKANFNLIRVKVENID